MSHAIHARLQSLTDEIQELIHENKELKLKLTLGRRDDWVLGKKDHTIKFVPTKPVPVSQEYVANLEYDLRTLRKQVGIVGEDLQYLRTNNSILKGQRDVSIKNHTAEKRRHAITLSTLDNLRIGVGFLEDEVTKLKVEAAGGPEG